LPCRTSPKPVLQNLPCLPAILAESGSIGSAPGDGAAGDAWLRQALSGQHRPYDRALA